VVSVVPSFTMFGLDISWLCVCPGMWFGSACVCVVDVVIRVPFVGVGWYVAYLGNDVVVDILDAVGCVMWE